MGAALAAPALRNEPDYAYTASQQYDIVVSENSFKFDLIEPTPGKFTFADADRLVAFAHAHGQQVRGHTLVWVQQAPQWAKAIHNRDQLIAVMRNHIHAVVSHFKGRVAQWDVVNEAFTGYGTLSTDSFWQQTIGDDYLDLAFQFAHEADPDAKLFYNDFLAEGVNAKADGILAFVKGMRARGIPIDGVGFQGHIAVNPDLVSYAANMKRFNDAGFETAYTEVDVGLHLPASQAELQDQATTYAGMLNVCLQAPNCHTFVTWGFTDRHSWISSQIPGYGDALPFDVALNPKPAYWAMINRLT